MGVIVLDDWKVRGNMRYRIVVDEELIQTIATVDDNEIAEIKKLLKKLLNTDIITVYDIHKAVKDGKVTISKKTESEVRNILKKRGYNDRHISTIINYLTEKGVLP